MRGKGSLSNYRKLKALAFEYGAALFGVADTVPVKDSFCIEPSSVCEGLDRGISIGVRLSERVVGTITDVPTRIYAFHYKRVNSLLDEITLKLSNFIQNSGYSALPVPASFIEDWDRMRGAVSHKKIGHLAGNGYIGRSGLLVNPKYGAAVRYATVLTDMPLKTGKPVKAGCGECAACVALCPAKAIKKQAKDLDLEACRGLLKTFANRPGIGHSICGICVKACKGKRNKKYSGGTNGGGKDT
jgi:epoxyqueuosine reductase QueG